MDKKIKCKFCKGTAYIILEEGRYFVVCTECDDKRLLKEYNLKANNQ